MNIGKWMHWGAGALIVIAHAVLFISLARNRHTVAPDRQAYEERWGCLYVLLVGLGTVLLIGGGFLS